jgi:poly-gamma-glutamate synthesis protein (capsule biosynthesis protein)
MKTGLTLALTGDSIINRRISLTEDERFHSLVEVLRGADVSFTHFESLIHDYEGPEIYPAAQAGWTWMRAPGHVAEELKWAGFDLVSLASNHVLDYSYGGLYSTWRALEGAGLVHAGTGRTLGEARSPAYLDTAKGRVALVSMCSTFTGWAPAGEARHDVKGRPGLNPLRYYYKVSAAKLALIRELAVAMGMEVLHADGMWIINPPGLQMATQKYVEADVEDMVTVADEEDAEGNLRAIRDAARQADIVIAHLHTHEFHPLKGLSVPAHFVQPFARACIEAGANVFVSQGSHAPLRGIEIHRGRPILYDPGDFMGMSDTVTRQPSDFYFRPGYEASVRESEATPADAYDAKRALPKKTNPPGGNYSGRVVGSVVAVCSLSDSGGLEDLVLHPLTLVSKPRAGKGIPLAADAQMAESIIRYLADLSAPFGTKVVFKDGKGRVEL